MTVERAILVCLPADTPGLTQLVTDMRGAKLRAEEAAPGERTDVIRYEEHSTRIERLAGELLVAEAADCLDVPLLDQEPRDSVFDKANAAQLPTTDARIVARIEAGEVIVELRDPFGEGLPVVAHPVSPSAPPEVAVSWKALAADGTELEGPDAVALRFRQKLHAAVNGVPQAYMLPSGVSNAVLTKELRSFVTGDPTIRCSVRVSYKDGSFGPDFPLRCLPVADGVPVNWVTYHFAMLSIRHTEMDVVVDGAWLRNSDISRHRPAGQTDQLAYDLSRSQLKKLCKHGPVLMYLYQTGLETAVVGIYRAVTEWLMEHPGTLCVVPMFFRRESEDQAHAPVVAGYQQQSTFVRGKPWTT